MLRLRKLVWEFRHRSALMVYPSVALARAGFAARRAGSGGVKAHVLLAAPGGGNIGDQAMVESFVENVAGPVKIIVRDPDAISFADLPRDRVEPVVLPELIYGRKLARHLRDVRRFRALMDDAASFSVVGADIMDGAYNLRASMRRALMAELASARGVDTRVLGFSWNARPHRAAAGALRRASAAGAALMLRDPLSAGRAERDGLHNVVGVADTVFSLRRVDRAVVSDLLPGISSGARVALVNASAHVGGSLDQATDYARIVRHLRAAGLEVVLVPHVSGATSDDMAACRQVINELGPGVVTFVDRVLSPAQVKGLCARSELVVTGRMHLAVMALSAGVPAIALATQGKVEGLMEIFGTPELCVTPRPGMADEVIALVDRILRDDAGVTDRVRGGLPAARQLSALNFTALAS